MKTVVKEIMKLWLFSVAMHYGDHEKTALKDFAPVYLFSVATGV